MINSPTITFDQPLQRPNTLKQRVYEQLCRLMQAQGFDSDRLYSTAQLAGSLGVSRTPVREALLQMMAEGYLVMVDGRGFRIRNYSSAEIRDFFEVRQLVEQHCLIGGGERLIACDLPKLRECQQGMMQAVTDGDRASFLEADKNFHLTLVRAHGNAQLEAVMQNARNLIVVFGQRAVTHEGRLAEVLVEHQAIIDALSRGNIAAAAGALQVHLDMTQQHLIGKDSA